MDILYVSSLCSNSKFSKLFANATVKPTQPAQKYHQLMVEGLAQNEGTSIKVLSAIPVSRLDVITILLHKRNRRSEWDRI